MSDGPDLYAALGVDRSASDQEIRRVYRKLAREHHPDLNPGKPEAEEKFKAISAAYDVLSNKEKRALYDEFGHDGLRGGFDPEQARAYRRWADTRAERGSTPFGGVGFEDVPMEFDLDELLGRTRSRGRANASPFPMAGEDVLATVELDLGSALRGAEIALELPLKHSCDACAGSGVRPRSEPERCEACGGSGRSQVVRGPMRMLVTCSACGGSGHVGDPCERCSGRGLIESRESLRVRIPKGADNGDELRVRGKGAPGHFGGPPGDVVIHTRVKPHAHFERTGLDLRIKLPITLGEAARGATVAVPTPSGTVQLKVPARSQQGAQLRLRGRGVERGSEHGDLYVVLDVQMPDQDDPAIAAALSELEHYYSKNVREGVEL